MVREGENEMTEHTDSDLRRVAAEALAEHRLSERDAPERARLERRLTLQYTIQQALGVLPVVDCNGLNAQVGDLIFSLVSPAGRSGSLHVRQAGGARWYAAQSLVLLGLALEGMDKDGEGHNG